MICTDRAFEISVGTSHHLIRLCRLFAQLLQPRLSTQADAEAGMVGLFSPQNESIAGVCTRPAGQLWPAPQHLTEPVLLIAATSANEFRDFTSRGSSTDKRNSFSAD